VSGTILPDYRIEPLELGFGEIHALETQTAKKTFRVTPVQMESLKIIDVKPSSNLYSASILPSGKGSYVRWFIACQFGNGSRSSGH